MIKATFIFPNKESAFVHLLICSSEDSAGELDSPYHRFKLNCIYNSSYIKVTWNGTKRFRMGWRSYKEEREKVNS
jgi:hypothetical protein